MGWILERFRGCTALSGLPSLAAACCVAPAHGHKDVGICTSTRILLSPLILDSTVLAGLVFLYSSCHPLFRVGIVGASKIRAGSPCLFWAQRPAPLTLHIVFPGLCSTALALDWSDPILPNTSRVFRRRPRFDTSLSSEDSRRNSVVPSADTPR